MAAKKFLTIKLTGLEKSIQRLRFYQVDKIRRVQAVVSKYLLLGESGAKERAPVDTGRLRSAIYSSPFANGLGGVVAVAVEYAPYVELGTRLIVAQPFLFPALEAIRLDFRAELLQALRTQ